MNFNMISDLELLIYIIALILIYHGVKILNQATQALEPKNLDMADQGKPLNQRSYIVYISVVLLAYVFVCKIPGYTAETLLFFCCLLLLIIVSDYFIDVKKIIDLGYPETYLYLYKKSQIFNGLGILAIVSMSIFRLAQFFS